MEVEAAGLVRVLVHPSLVLVPRQVVQAPVPIRGRRQRDHRAVARDEHAIALPRDVEALHLLDHRVDRDVDTDDAFEEFTGVDWRNARHDPALARRIEVGLGPHHPAPRIVLGVRQVVEVVLRDRHRVVVLVRRQEPRIDVIQAVPGVEVDRRHQRILGLDLAHQAVDVLELGEFGQVMAALLPIRRGIEHRRTAVVLRAVVYAAGGQCQVLGERRAPRIAQRAADLVGVHPGQGADGGQLLVDHPRLLPGHHAQVGAGAVAQVFDLRIADGGIGQQVGGDQHRFDQKQGNQGAVQEGTPDPLAQPNAFVGVRHVSFCRRMGGRLGPDPAILVVMKRYKST